VALENKSGRIPQGIRPLSLALIDYCSKSMTFIDEKKSIDLTNIIISGDRNFG
jgi:hypothetical protein